MRALPIPPENDGDDGATELARAWLGNGSCILDNLENDYGGLQFNDGVAGSRGDIPRGQTWAKLNHW